MAAGTYELHQDLAVFSGHAEGGEEIRFGMNYAFPGGRVYFNAFFPASDSELRYHRQWFRKMTRRVATYPRSWC